MILKEVTASLYPWDIADEGLDNCLDNLCVRANVNSVYLVGLMHKEKRPHTNMFFDHNPKRKFYLPEDSRLCYDVDPTKFGHLPIKPLKTERDFLAGKDWLDVMTKGARDRGLKTGIEISHTFYDVGLATEKMPELLQQRMDGSRTGFFCLNNEIVREYIGILYSETVARHDVDFIQTCMRIFEYRTVDYAWYMDKPSDHPIRRLLGVALGTCFCDSCRRKARSLGFDWDGMMDELKELHAIAGVRYAETGKTIEQHLMLLSNMSETILLLRYPGLYRWLDFRCRSITEAFCQLHTALQKAKPGIDLRYNNDAHHEELCGLQYTQVKDHLDSVRLSDYIEQHGNLSENAFINKKRNLYKVREGIGFDKALLATIAVRPNATPEIIKKSLLHLSETGIDGLSLAHYDGARMHHLDAVKQGMAEAGMLVRSA